MTNSGKNQLLQEAAQMLRNLPDNRLNSFYEKLDIRPNKYKKDLLSLYFTMVLEGNHSKETIPKIHRILLELGQKPKPSMSTNEPIAAVEELFESAANSAQTSEPVAVYRELRYFAPRIDEALAAVGEGHRIQGVEANFRNNGNNNNNNNNENAANTMNRGANKKGKGAAAGGKRKTRKSKKSRKQSR